jgi:protein-S-isoprenylcysteine O-methyltransferase Ste14
LSATQGIRPVNQTARRHLLQAVAAVLVVALVFGQSGWTSHTMHEALEMTGLACVLACIFGRLWAILYVGGRKNAELVTEGPFSITRNPLYLFSCLGAFGVGLMFASIIAAFALAGLVFLVLHVTASREADFLLARFGDAYRDYAARTPFFWPDPRLFRTGEVGTFSPRILGSTFIDTLWFLAAFPAVEALEWAHEGGLLPTLFLLY